MIFGCAPSWGVNADTKLVNEISDILLNRYSRDSLELQIPRCFDDLYSVDAEFEMAISNTTQPLRLVYINNVVTRKAGLIFINNLYYITKGKDNEDSKQLFAKG